MKSDLSIVVVAALATLAGGDNLRAQRNFELVVPIDRADTTEPASRASSLPVEKPSVSVTSLTAPKNAKKSFESAWKEFYGPKPNYAKVIGDLEQAVKIHPPYTVAWVLLGKTRIIIDQETGAREAFERAIASDPKTTAAYLPLALIELKNGRDEEAARLADRLLTIDPNFAEAHLYRAIAYYNLRKLDIAKQSLRIILKSGDDNLFLRAQFMSASMLSDRIRSLLSQWEAVEQVR